MFFWVLTESQKDQPPFLEVKKKTHPYSCNPKDVRSWGSTRRRLGISGRGCFTTLGRVSNGHGPGRSHLLGCLCNQVPTCAVCTWRSPRQAHYQRSFKEFDLEGRALGFLSNDLGCINSRSSKQRRFRLAEIDILISKSS